MKRFVLAVLVGALGAAGTVTFPQSAKADYAYERHAGFYRGDYPYEYREHRYHRDRGYYRDHDYYRDRGYYHRPYYYGGYYGGDYPYHRSHIQLVVPLIFR